ncbi:hypothetical protein ACFX5Q_27900 [Mesorhizobium sp. IMUNJ 23033]|uniref:hypothetical protein n=1 Tax=Mesorhizobium sp. IMUNJ 23033 TaxID=3378039 RepID=UPI00384C6D2D
MASRKSIATRPLGYELHVHNVVGLVIGQVDLRGGFAGGDGGTTAARPRRKNDRHGDQRRFDFAHCAISIKLAAPGNGSMIPANARRK